MKYLNLKDIEKTMVSYADLINVPLRGVSEQFTFIDNSIIPAGYRTGMDDIKTKFSKRILVRFSVYEKLKKIQKKLCSINPDLSLFVTYGFRPMEVQIEYFLRQLKKISSVGYYANPSDLYEEVHRYIAVPSVSGHPTGGAVDLMLIDKKSNEPVDFGSAIYDFSSKRSYTFYPKLPQLARLNRMLLRKLMMEENFAPFDGEWWHFSYGDKEWAFYYKRKFAIYAQVKLRGFKIKS